MYQNVVSKKVCAKILFTNNDIVLDFIDSDLVRFFGDNMDIVNVDIDNINPHDVNFDEDDLETIIHVRLMGMRYRFKQRKAFKKCCTLMDKTRHCQHMKL